MRIVKNRSIPNVPDERLVESLVLLHATLHTHEGLAGFDNTRRGLVDLGAKLLLVRAELERRNIPTPILNCRWCT